MPARVVGKYPEDHQGYLNAGLRDQSLFEQEAEVIIQSGNQPIALEVTEGSEPSDGERLFKPKPISSFSMFPPPREDIENAKAAVREQGIGGVRVTLDRSIFEAERYSAERFPYEFRLYGAAHGKALVKAFEDGKYVNPYNQRVTHVAEPLFSVVAEPNDKFQSDILALILGFSISQDIFRGLVAEQKSLGNFPNVENLSRSNPGILVAADYVTFEQHGKTFLLAPVRQKLVRDQMSWIATPSMSKAEMRPDHLMSLKENSTPSMHTLIETMSAFLPAARDWCQPHSVGRANVIIGRTDRGTFKVGSVLQIDERLIPEFQHDMNEQSGGQHQNLAAVEIDFDGGLSQLHRIYSLGDESVPDVSAVQSSNTLTSVISQMSWAHRIG